MIMDEAANKVIGASQVIFKAQTDKAWITTHALLRTIINPESPYDCDLVFFYALLFCPCQEHTNYCSMCP